MSLGLDFGVGGGQNCGEILENNYCTIFCVSVEIISPITAEFMVGARDNYHSTTKELIYSFSFTHIHVQMIIQ
jgi:hypothetical protein